jgi:hypothetical protein
MDANAREMTLLDAVQACDCDVDAVVERLENGQLILSGNFKGDEDAIARYARRDDDVPVFDSSMWAAFGA